MFAGTDYPLFSIFFTMLYFFVFVLWIMLLFQILSDIFKSHDLGGGMKALWIFFIIFLPFLGVLIYVIARGGSMHERQAQAAAMQQASFEKYIQEVAAKKS